MDTDLLNTWEEVFKKGLLSFWILLLLNSREAYPFEMKELIENFSQGTITADSNSIYRALNRFEKLGLVSSKMTRSASGPDRRYYALTPDGLNLLGHFIQRNLLVFQQEDISKQMRSVIDELTKAGEL